MCPIAPLCDGSKRPGSRSRRLPGLTRGESYEEVLATLQCSLSLFGSTHPAFDHRGDTLAHNSGLPMTNGDRKGIPLRTLADVQAALAQAKWKNVDVALGDHPHLEITWKTSSRRLLKQDETSVEHSSRTSRPTHEGKKTPPVARRDQRRKVNRSSLGAAQDRPGLQILCLAEDRKSCFPVRLRTKEPTSDRVSPTSPEQDRTQRVLRNGIRTMFQDSPSDAR